LSRDIYIGDIQVEGGYTSTLADINGQSGQITLTELGGTDYVIYDISSFYTYSQSILCLANIYQLVFHQVLQTGVVIKDFV
jgi:hypothetical protein